MHSSSGPSKERRIGGAPLTRVEGEGSLLVEVRDDVVSNVRLSIFEPPRYFEALLQGRSYMEIPDVTARICGICPVAYQMSSCAAVEAACGVEVSEPIRRLRRLLYCGEWIQSHALHVYLLHAPDFVGCADAVELARQAPSVVERGLRLKRVGNLLMERIGGRAIHPVNVRVGGFYRAPTREDVRSLLEPLRQAEADALATVEWASGLAFPEVEREYRFVALRGPAGYPLEGGRVVTSFGLELTAAEFAEIAVEEHVEHSTALRARIDDVPYLTGPLARYALNHDLLGPSAQQAADRAGLGHSCHNPFRSIVVRAVELVAACAEARSLAEAYEAPRPAWVPVEPRASRGFGVTEAPRGLLLIGVELAEDGRVKWVRITPPTAQNQLSIEEDLREVVGASLELDDETLTRRCEQAVRNHDPCISCSAHFLDLQRVQR